MRAETAALDKKGDLVLGRRASRRQKRGMSQTYVITWRDAETSEETTLPIAKYGLGRKVTDVSMYCCSAAAVCTANGRRNSGQSLAHVLSYG